MGGFFFFDVDWQVLLLRVVEAIDGFEVFFFCILGLLVCGVDNFCLFYFQVFEYWEVFQEIIEDCSIVQVVEGVLEKDFKF